MWISSGRRLVIISCGIAEDFPVGGRVDVGEGFWLELCVGSLIDEYRTHAFRKVGLPADVFAEWNFEREFVADVGLGAGGGDEFEGGHDGGGAGVGDVLVDEVAEFSGEMVVDFVPGGVAEGGLDIVNIGFELWVFRWGFLVCGECLVDAVLDDIAVKGVKILTGNVVGGETGVEHVDGVEPVAGDGEEPGHGRGFSTICSHHVLHHVGHAHIWHESDGHFGHGGQGVFRDDAVAAVSGNTEAPAHGDAVDKRNVGFGEVGDIAVHDVFGGEEFVGAFGCAGKQVFPGEPHVAAGAEGFGRIGVNEYLGDLRVRRPFGQVLVDDAHHIGGEGIERPGPVEFQNPGGVLLPGDNKLVGHGTSVPQWSPQRGACGKSMHRPNTLWKKLFCRTLQGIGY